MRHGRARGFTLVELLVVIVIIGILAALLLPAIAKAIRNGKLASDANNLKQLWTMEWNYATTFGGRSKQMPPDTGGAFWIKLTSTTPPLIDTTLADIFDCVISPTAPPAGSAQYRGPIADVATFGDGEPVGSDLAGAHGPSEGGIVLRKSGDVMNYSEIDPVWIAAGSRTTP